MSEHMDNMFETVGAQSIHDAFKLPQAFLDYSFLLLHHSAMLVQAVELSNFQDECPV